MQRSSLRSRRARLVVALVGLVALGAGAPAWACVPQPFIVVQPQASGASGTEVEVVGTNFDPGPAEIRWNGLDGALLAKAEGPSFAATITVPDDAEGLYTLIALSRGAQGEVIGTARAAFAVTGEDQATPPPAPPPAAEDTEASSSPLVPMAFGAGLMALGGVGGAALDRRRRQR